MESENLEASDSARTIISSESISTSEHPAADSSQQTKHQPATSVADSSVPSQIDTDMDDESDPPVTHALEALLGGLGSSGDHAIGTDLVSKPEITQEPTAPAEDSNVVQVTKDTVADVPDSEDMGDITTMSVQNGATPIILDGPPTNWEKINALSPIEPPSASIPSIPGLFSLGSSSVPKADFPRAHTEEKRAGINGGDTEMAEDNFVTKAAIASGGASEPGNQRSNEPVTASVDDEAVEDARPEWEEDSSPIESSSDDSSDDSSSDESDEGTSAYKLLSPEEQARILMEGDGGSDDEGGDKGKGSGGHLRTKNEVPEVVIPKPDVVITEQMPIVELGHVEQTVDNILLIMAKTTGEYKVLESGSVLCLEDRSVIGVVSETIGRVQKPLYSVLFTNAGELAAAGLSRGVKVFYSEQHSTFVFTQALKAYKGSDASNLHDEEVGTEEMEFSDDEAEADHKKRVKQQRLEKKGGKMQQNGGSGRGGHPLQQQHNAPYNASTGISYDETDDGPYKPLARPAGYADSVGRSEAPQEGTYQGGYERPKQDQGRDQRDRGRGDRGRGRGDRGRGDRGRGRGGFQDRRGSSGFSLPPQTQGGRGYAPSPAPGAFPSPVFPPQNFAQTPPAMPSPNFYNAPSPQQYPPPKLPQFPGWQQFQAPPPYQQQNQYQQPQQNAQNWPNPQAFPGGTFVNPAFFNQPGNSGLWNPQNQQGGNGPHGA